ncbi:MAG TPA: hypothetical protein VGS80_11965 [Ktedonobacterales bacterium]|nr:hypothetical protein [Ktedonobacterales bacterium]
MASAVIRRGRARPSSERLGGTALRCMPRHYNGVGLHSWQAAGTADISGSKMRL